MCDEKSLAAHSKTLHRHYTLHIEHSTIQMIERIIIAGAGGQGIMLMGKVLAEAAMLEGKHVTWLPAYGAEVRGGTSHCMIVISDKEIGSPYIQKADALIVMNEPSLKKFTKRINSRGLLIVNSSLVRGVVELDEGADIIKRPFTDIAIKMGNIKVANMIALGCFIKQRGAVDIKSASSVIAAIAPKDKRDLVEVNQKALFEGERLR